MHAVAIQRNFLLCSCSDSLCSQSFSCYIIVKLATATIKIFLWQLIICSYVQYRGDPFIYIILINIFTTAAMHQIKCIIVFC